MQWYGKLVEFRSLLSSKTQFALFTATATPKTKYTIFEMLNLSPSRVFCIETDPIRKNILYIFHYIDKDQSMEKVFRPIIEEVKQNKENTTKTLIFCQTRKQCFLLYRIFKVNLDENMYCDDELTPERRFVDMFHAGTPESVKTHVVNEMGNAYSHLRVLICTSAFGMGINCQGLYRSIHFGPPDTIETLIQETGRVGRDGNDSISYVLYNGLLTSRCGFEVKRLVQIECYREEIGQNFSAYSSDNAPVPCKCCVKCCTKCDCGPNCMKGGLHFNLFDTKETSGQFTHQTSSSCVRTVSESQRTLLKTKLDSFKDAVRSAGCSNFKPVSCSTMLFEFDSLQVQQLLSWCEKIFTFRDIFKLAEIWRYKHAKKILSIFQEVFGDIDITFNEMDFDEEDFEAMEIVHDDWNELQENSSSFISVSSTLMEELNQTDQTDQGEMSDVQVGNESDLIVPITDNINW